MATSPSVDNVVSAKGALLRLADGREIIDAISSWWVITHGHCQPEIVDAIQAQVSQLDQVLFANFSHHPAEQVTERLSELLPSQLNRFFFSDNGSTSVEVAIKMLLQYWQQIGEPQRKMFLTFEDSYHGDTVGAMSVSGDSVFIQPYKSVLFATTKIKQGRLSTDPIETYLDDFENHLLQNSEHIAGVIIEPLIQGAGGMRIWPPLALEKICKLCQQRNIPVIFDEVMTGFGRTGRHFAFEHLLVVPDILCLSKGLTGGSLPLSLTVASELIYSQFLSDQKEKMFFHGHSFTGNPISCAAAAANLKILLEQDIQKDLQKIESLNASRLQRWKEDERVKDARNLGVVGAIELHSSSEGYCSVETASLFQFAYDRGVFLRPLGNVIYILPPYCTSDAQLHQIWDIIDEWLLRQF